MKKVISMLVLGLICFTTTIKAQGVLQIIPVSILAQTPAGVIKALDTAVNADTTYFIIDTNLNNTHGSTATTTPGHIESYSDVVYEWTAIPSISGTTTTGSTMIFQGSETGTFSNGGDWVTLIGDQTQYAGGSSFTISGSTTLYGYFIQPKQQFKHVRARYISAGTQTSTITMRAYVRPHG